MKIEEGVPLARHTTLGTGGPARFFARPETVGELEEALAFAVEHDVAVAVVGLGSNLLVTDDRVDRLVLRLAGELTAVAVDGERSSRAGGARTLSCSTAHERPAWAGSSSRARSPARRAAASG